MVCFDQVPQIGFPIPQHPPYIPLGVGESFPTPHRLGRPHRWTLLDQWGNLRTIRSLAPSEEGRL